MSSSAGRHGLLSAVALLLGTVAAGVVGVLVLVDGPTEVAMPPAADHPACTAAAEHWPDELQGLTPRETEPSHPSIRAWGDPAVVARCGMPAMPPTEDQCVVVDEIGWVAEDLGGATRLTSFGRDPAIEVIVPGEQGPGPLLLPAFSDAVEQLPTNDYTCS